MSFLPQFFTCLVILFACEVAAGIWGFINRDTVRLHILYIYTQKICILRLSLSRFLSVQISTELINFYDAAYIKALDPVDTPSRQAASKVLEVFHDTVSCQNPFFHQNPLFWTVNNPYHFFALSQYLAGVLW